MKKSKFSESQIVSISKESDAGMTVAELIRKHGISVGLTCFCGQIRFSTRGMNHVQESESICAGVSASVIYQANLK